MVGLPVQHPLGADSQHQADPRLAMRSPEAGVAQGRLGAPMGKLVQRRPCREGKRTASRRTGDLPDLRGHPARIVVRRELGHQRHARPAGQQVRLDLREVAAQRGRGPNARDPYRFKPIHFASSRAVRPLDQLDTKPSPSDRSRSPGRRLSPPTPELSARPSQVERGRGVARLRPDHDPEHRPLSRSRPRPSAPGPGPGTRRWGKHCHESREPAPETSRSGPARRRARPRRSTRSGPPGNPRPRRGARRRPPGSVRAIPTPG